jgi:hypothetical protein
VQLAGIGPIVTFAVPPDRNWIVTDPSAAA